jgi:hypothetical protein
MTAAGGPGHERDLNTLRGQAAQALPFPALPCRAPPINRTDKACQRQLPDTCTHIRRLL